MSEAKPVNPTPAELALLAAHYGLQPMSLTGRCGDGFQRDRGRLVHLASGHVGPALCGQREGRTSAGWQVVDAEVSCSRCLRRVQSELATIATIDPADAMLRQREES